MRIPFLKPKKKGEPAPIRAKRKKAEVIHPDQERIKRVENYEKKLSGNSLKRRSYRHG